MNSSVLGTLVQCELRTGHRLTHALTISRAQPDWTMMRRTGITLTHLSGSLMTRGQDGSVGWYCARRVQTHWNTGYD